MTAVAEVSDSPLFTHGTSKVQPSNDQLNSVLELLRSAIPVIRPLADTSILFSYLDLATRDISKRVNKWKIVDEKEFESKLPERLFPAEWDQLSKKRPTYKALSQFSLLDPAPGLSRPILQYLSHSTTLKPREFLESYKIWIASHIRKTIDIVDGLDALPSETPPSVIARRAHYAFAEIFGIAKSLHAVCELCPNLKVELEKLRERTSYLLELYRYEDDILTAGIEPVLWDISKHGEEASENSEKRPFKLALYENQQSPLVHLTHRFPTDPDSFNPDLVPPKAEKLVSYLARRMRRARETPLILVVADTEFHALYISRYLRASFTTGPHADILSELRIATVTGGSKAKERREGLEGFADEKVDLLVTTELRKPPTIVPSRRMLVLSLSQQAKSLAYYPFISAFREAGNPVHIITFRTEGSSDQYRRERAKRFREGPPDYFSGEGVDEEFSRKTVLNDPDAVRFFSRMDRALNKIDASLAERGRIHKETLRKFFEGASQAVSEARYTYSGPRNKELTQKKFGAAASNYLHRSYMRLQQEREYLGSETAARSFAVRFLALRSFTSLQLNREFVFNRPFFESLSSFLTYVSTDAENFDFDAPPLHVAFYTPELRTVIRKTLERGIEYLSEWHDANIAGSAKGEPFRQFIYKLQRDEEALKG